MVDWLSLAVPLAYLGILIGSLATFSSLYRKRKYQKAATLEPWFPAHLQRDIYFSLLHLDPSAQKEKTPAVPESVVKAALLRRAKEDIRRVLALRSQKQALSVLLQRGSVGDDLWQRFLRAEKEMEEEVKDVVAEANAYVPNWGQTIFQSANEMMNNDIYRQRVSEQQEKLAEEKEWWSKKKATTQEQFMKELNEGSEAASPSVQSPAPKSPEPASEPISESVPAAPAAAVQPSDDEAVLVEAEPSISGTPSGGKKKKGKGKK
ncbi:Sec62/63 complex subunit Sec66 [Penicillium pulvis]|uniref:Sec62/63 complex subunit Sec66 n=1 Tax=Penicillium pulvis TaxID=1562058 RepID=UPI00254928D2|nr:Sec62/63 complex subunit Sec66 [Penicillium pulvis]KAJ5806190.1 Sec62/63 complex subunit Sec66 [Penicillium pulvis]